MKISIKSSTAVSRLTLELDDVQKRCTARTITAEDILQAFARIESEVGIPACAWDGTKVRVDLNAQSFPSAYKYTPESTYFTAENARGRWNVTGIYRSTTAAPSLGVQCIFSDTTKDAILHRYSSFSI